MKQMTSFACDLWQSLQEVCCHKERLQFQFLISTWLSGTCSTVAKIPQRGERYLQKKMFSAYSTMNWELKNKPYDIQEEHFNKTRMDYTYDPNTFFATLKTSLALMLIYYRYNLLLQKEHYC